MFFMSKRWSNSPFEVPVEQISATQVAEFLVYMMGRYDEYYYSSPFHDLRDNGRFVVDMDDSREKAIIYYTKPKRGWVESAPRKACSINSNPWVIPPVVLDALSE